jgi:hypothetical protein
VFGDEPAVGDIHGDAQERGPGSGAPILPHNDARTRPDVGAAV